MSKHIIQKIVLEGKGSSIEYSFSDVAVKMFNIVIDTSSVNPNFTKTIIIRSSDLKNLLYQFLKKLFDLANLELFLLSSVKKLTIEEINNEYMLNAVIIGDQLKDHNVKDVVKHIENKDIIIKEDQSGCTSQINIIVERLHEV